ncbi:MAG: hypothetical protein WC413_02845 [Candidatus Nanoarchaeia archaeon]
MKKLGIIFLVLILSISFVLAEETLPTNETETITVCNETQCDEACVKCDNNICHKEGYECKEDLSIEKISPEKVQLGLNQINILLKNMGEQDLANVYAKLSGNGIETQEEIPIDNLPVGQKDYTFVKIEASKSGSIDLVVKLYVDDELLKQDIKSIYVIAEEKQPTETFNITELSNALATLKKEYNLLEQEYQNKKLEGFPVDIYKGDLEDINTNIKSAQTYFYQENYKNAKISLDLASETVTDLKEKLSNAKKQEKTLGQKIKENLTYIAGIAAALVSILTAYKLIGNHINKKKIMELHQKGKDKLLTFKQKVELNEIHTKARKKKAKKKEEIKELKKEIKEDEE